MRFTTLTPWPAVVCLELFELNTASLAFEMRHYRESESLFPAE
jgi:hypothetical protein